ncbi:hypothetical protein ACFQE1_02590 [Halobium palmae]|uniref:DUF8163 domain-containing protein n=1 Tax=Halobium palmae TaxID=1776492 RepID=A0ABD5RV66_9EURY
MTVHDRRGVTTQTRWFSPRQVVAAIVAMLGFVVTRNPLELAAGVGVAVGMLVLAPPYWFVLAQLLFLTTMAGSPSSLLVIGEGGLVLGLAIASSSHWSGRDSVLLLIVTGGAVALAGGTFLAWDSLWLAMGILCSAIALALYGLYRYGLVQLRLVGGLS